MDYAVTLIIHKYIDTTMSSMNPSAMLADSLSDFSKAAYQAFTAVESQSRQEVARALADAREAKLERDKAVRDLHAFQLEAQSWKQEVVASKASLTQAELTIAHQTETLATQLDTIAQLRRELAQWKDQSRNWQEHFLRVEQERCAQASRIDELVVEKLQYPRPSGNPNSLFTPKASKVTSAITSAPSSTTTKRNSGPSPAQPPAYKLADPPSPAEIDLTMDTWTDHISSNSRSGQKPSRPTARSQAHLARDPQAEHQHQQEVISSSSSKRPRKSNTNAHNAQLADPPAHIRSSTVIRRVQAVINVKQEDSEGEYPENVGHKETVSTKKKEESIQIAFTPAASVEKQGQHQRKWTPRSRVIHDEDEDDASDGQAWGSDSEDVPVKKTNLRQRGQINYREDEDDDEEDDELMMGSQENYEESYGTTVRVQPNDRLPKRAPPKKKRRIAAR
ncbi:hypothetical protein M413DRAFT_9890 [Hebeloma cylindrosporum]|uniref:Uncharacterized protein n=1 Tax=Hebeloma cylindrosporum TaxID=76867 RepID=A0A0C2XZW3_HEBCY|nr:hypothetical protein M413DRAFT_9890 [Hebeloma cylindrosporum h7]